MATLPNYTLKAQLQRSLIYEDLKKCQAKLEQSRIAEVNLRAELVLKLESLAGDVGRAANKIGTRQWEDGCTGLCCDDGAIDRLREHEDALTECISEIKYLECIIEDAQNDLDDDALWIGVA